MVKPLLEEDWRDYDEKKNEVKQNAHFFACTETWEVNYLKDKIAQKNPHIDKILITKAIQLCCKELRAQQSPDTFAECVLKKLSRV